MLFGIKTNSLYKDEKPIISLLDTTVEEIIDDTNKITAMRWLYVVLKSHSYFYTLRHTSSDSTLLSKVRYPIFNLEILV